MQGNFIFKVENRSDIWYNQIQSSSGKGVFVKLTVNTLGKKRFFSVPCFIADNYLKLADGPAIKLIIYLLSDESGSFEPENVCKKLGISKSALDDSILFWKEQGVISEAPGEAVETEAVGADKKSVQPPQDTKVFHRGYSAKDIADLVNTDASLKELLAEAEKTLGRVLKHSEHEMLISLKEYYGFTPQSIILLLEYCCGMDKTAPRYIETVAIDFFDKGITEFLDIDEEINRRRENESFEGAVIRDFGLKTKLTSKQSQFIASWREMGFDIEMISAARERCVDATNQLSFSYINKILQNWASKNIFTPAAIADDSRPPKGSDERESSFDLDDWDNFTLGIDDSNKK